MEDGAASGRPGLDDARGTAGNETGGYPAPWNEVPQPPVGGSEVSGSEGPEWWPYAAELPGWHVWRGISGLVYARRRSTSPPLVVRGEDAVDLRDAIRREEFLRSI
jgi:hypothetical protein